MLRRKAYDKLISWKRDSNKKALCIIGARQIGKTTIIREFGKNNYEAYIEINFIENPEAIRIFDGELDPNTLITNITAFVQRPLIPNNTLIFFDEIQECPNARTAIKFLVEDGRFDYIESGSLLGARYKEIPSYAVGFEEIYYMYPMDFEEYMWANNVNESTIEYLKDCFKSKRAVSDVVHKTMNKLFFSYIVVGGVPEAVDTYINTHDIAKVINIQRIILELYRLDISKYSKGSEKLKIQAIFESIPSQLNDKNRRFNISSLDKNARLNRYENYFNWLINAGVALASYNTEEPLIPLHLNEKCSLFRLYMNDVGLLCAASMENIQFAILNGDLSINMGSILENVYAQELKSKGFNLFYFDNKKIGEIDFVIQNGQAIDIYEIKSGKDYKKHKALDSLLKVKNYSFKNIYVFNKDNINKEGNIYYLPWYMMAFIEAPKIPSEMIYEIDLAALNNI